MLSWQMSMSAPVFVKNKNELFYSESLYHYNNSPNSHHWCVSCLRMLLIFVRLIQMQHPLLNSLANCIFLGGWGDYIQEISYHISWSVEYYNILIYFWNLISSCISIHCGKLKRVCYYFIYIFEINQLSNWKQLFDFAIFSDIGDECMRWTLLFSLY